jgi:hypothetical protein
LPRLPHEIPIEEPAASRYRTATSMKVPPSVTDSETLSAVGALNQRLLAQMVWVVSGNVRPPGCWSEAPIKRRE